MNLSPVQENVIQTPGNLIVRASAGAGKTLTMVKKIEKEIQDNQSHRVIAAITFTIKAAQEIRERLAIDISQHFIGTNNSFVIEEIIKPFMKDVYGNDFELDLNTDYSLKVGNFKEGIDKIKEVSTLCSYRDNNKNFIFQLAKDVLEKSTACQLYLKARYFKIYIDEYQDCDRDMHSLFMYLCDELKIDTFVVGDEKQSIYTWRGAYPDAFKSIWDKSNFNGIFLGDNYRSCKQIQNYSNLLFPETRKLYSPTESLENIIWLYPDELSWPQEVLKHIDGSKKSALLRYSHANAFSGANSLTEAGLQYVYIPQTPIANISTESAWLYSAIAKYLIIDTYSAYDLSSENPNGNEFDDISITEIKKHLDQISFSAASNDGELFCANMIKLATYLGYSTLHDHIGKLFETVTNECYHSAYRSDDFVHVAITFHSSKGLEFDQVILFAEDFRLSNNEGIYNHYVAATRAREKLIIVRRDVYYAQLFKDELVQVLSESNLQLRDIVSRS